MNREIERKFRVQNDSWRKDVFASHLISQYYLSVHEGTVIRARKYDLECLLSIKHPQSPGHFLEFEYPIPETDFYALTRLPNFGSVEKYRHLIKYAGYVWEVDEFLGENAGLILAEIEWQSADSSTEQEIKIGIASVPLPDWVGEEVTYNVEYSNANLAKNSLKRRKNSKPTTINE